MTSSELTDEEREVLGFERDWWRYGEARETTIRDRFALSTSSYYRMLSALIDRPEALEHDPLLVRRLRRQRWIRRRQRSARRAGQGTAGLAHPNRSLR